MSAGCFDNATCLYNTNNNTNMMSLNQQQQQQHPPINHPLHNKQGIVSVLASDNIEDSSNKIHHNSIRRTLSADMSSQIWLQTNGLPASPVKRAKSSLQLQALGEDNQGNHHDTNKHHDDEKGLAFDEIWSSIQATNKSWGCLLSPATPNNKDGSGSDSGQVAAPYVHPLVKRTGSSLSEKSLEICTESLGSETGSDGFSFPPSDSEHEPEEEEEDEEGQEEEVEIKGCNNNNVQQPGVGVGVGVGINKFVYNNSRGPTTTSKRSMMVPPTRPSSFPPPLPSLTHRDDGSNLHIRSHRKDGRLVVEAVSVPSQNCFRAQRQDGRLLLTFSATTADDDDEDDQVTDDDDVQDKNYVPKVQLEEKQEETIMEVMKEDDKEAGAEAVVMKRPPPPPPPSSISCTTMTMMSKFMFMDLANKSTTWPRNYNTAVIKTLNKEDEEEDDEEVTTMPAVTKQSLPPRPANSSAALNNAYEYYWRRGSSTAVGMLKPLIAANTSNSKKGVGKHSKRNNNKLLYATHNLKRGSQQQEQEQVVVPLMQLRGCKEAKKTSLLLWEPHCIATS